eukprot:TRINITY_DN53948_c0_g1_i1.p2 TRINITY_DN53948_c0_g1~~TRINITY_DN53948_c0_g1_i1.p2  ORF type:complete len:196 (-),score=45.53 TRINITY_DN53948_c0_g1_i1:63-650(-)
MSSHADEDDALNNAFQQKSSDKNDGLTILKKDDPNWRIKTAAGELTLADIKRRQREELAEELEEGVSKRFKIVNYTSEDSVVVGEKRLFTFYCSICGELSVTSDVDVKVMPKRSTDSAFALDESMYFHKKYANFGEKILLRRPAGVEKQYRFYCRQCRNPLGYRCSPPSETSKYSYFYKDSLVDEQSQAMAFSKY